MSGMHPDTYGRSAAVYRAPAAAPVPTSTERVATTVCLVSVLVGLVLAGLGTLETITVAVGLFEVVLFIASTAGLVVIGVRRSRRGDTGVLRSIGRAVWRVVKFFA